MDKLKNFLIAFLLVFISVVIALGMLETYFRFFYDETDSLSASLSHKRWFERHWSPVNRIGFRDIEHEIPVLKGKKVIFIVGDSLAAGVGIKDHRKRFPDMVREKLPKVWELFLVAKPGWDTEQELEFLNGFQVRPDVVVLAYYVNDIKRAAKKEGLYRKILVKVPENRLLSFLLKKSYLFDYIFYRTGIFKLYNSTVERGFEQLIGHYRNDKAWKNHLRDFEDMIKYCKDKKARLVVIIFPHLSAIEKSREVTQKVYSALREKGVETIDLSEEFKNWKLSDLTANKNDAHPGKKVHRKVADMLLPVISKY